VPPSLVFPQNHATAPVAYQGNYLSRLAKRGVLRPEDGLELACSVRLTGLWRSDPVRPHHLVVLVLDDVAVPDELPR
jgi:hypothetical protein